MTPTEVKITRVFKSRGTTWFIIMLSLLAAIVAFQFPSSNYLPEKLGLFCDSPHLWISDPIFGFVLNVVGLFACGFLMVAINRIFNLLRTVSDLFVGIFFMMQVAYPDFMIVFSGSIILGFLVLLAMMLLFSIYQQPARTNRIFLIFFLISAGIIFQYGFIFYVFLFLAGCSQMRILSLRGLLAITMGIITPFWIFFGFGWLSSPQVDGWFSSQLIFILRSPDAPQMIVSVAFTLLIGLVAGVLNIFKVMSFNGQSRVFYTFLSMTGILTGLLCLFNFGNIFFYSTILFAVTSMQVCMCMRLYEKTRVYLLLPLMLVGYSAIYLWTVLD